MRHRTPRHDANGHRRRQLRARIKATSTHCALCDQPLDPRAPWPHPMATVIDEDIPRSKGGSPLDPSNTNAMHNQCNNWKSTMTLNEARNLLRFGAQTTKRLSLDEKRLLLSKSVGEWEPAAAHY